MEAEPMKDDEFLSIKSSLKEFSEAKFKMLEDIRAIRIKIKVAQQRSFRLQNELQEGRTRYEEFASHCDRLRTRLLQLSGYQLEISRLQSRYRELTANLHAKNQESESQLENLEAEFARQRNETTTEYARKVEEKRQQLERELSSLRSDLAAHDDDGILVEQKRKHDEELECLKTNIAMEMEQEKETVHHNNCKLKASSLQENIQELETKLFILRGGP
ncbi:uncharacterized protein LOC124311408 [Daphnia pulicaria]|uniref:uncharacterized protein LOC124311408 n=1 Tax=Daphnia pulicaria TaxID=35523 RepID=UPI001EEB8837|nr:uncharacterized protein LOC124311408 [Daphnia pulicaria]XP_046631843.1 uncharacterized protein LOC124311408 [Daphnia pulicaria]